ncbi:MAG: glycosyltransferase [Burkholderiaceae bacterium]
MGAAPSAAPMPAGLSHWPTISVVMPVYNGAETIAESIRSALDQSVPVHEIIVVDDGSTDGTIEQVQQFGDRVRIIRQNRGGNASARNQGVEAATGEWIAVLDADDIWAANKLERQVRLCEKADVIYSATRNFGDCSYVGDTTSIAAQCQPEDPLRALLIDNYITHSSVLMRRRAALAVGNYDASLKTACDWDLWLRLADAGYRFAGVPEVLVYYRWMQGTTSRRNHGLNTRNRLRVVKRAVERSGIKRIGIHTLRLALHSVCRTSAWFAASDQPWFALRWYLIAQVFRPTNYATWRELAAMLLRPLVDPLRGSSSASSGASGSTGNGAP